MAQKSFVIVGAGMGGVAVGLRLAHRGHRVTVLEKTEVVGGRNRPVQVNECRFDGGPTLMMMREPFEKLFSDVGERLDAHLSVEKLDPCYRVFYRDGFQLDGTPDREKMAALIEGVFGKRDADGFRRLIGDLERMYEEAVPKFVSRNYYGLGDFLNPDALATVMRHGMLGNFAKRVAKYVQDPRLRMLFSFQTMYLGLSPFEAPWVYAVLTYMEYGEGIWYPQGGLVKVASTIAELAEKRGAEIRLNCAVKSIDGKRVILESGECLEADAILVNADLPYAEKELLSTAGRRKATFSCSAYAMYLDYEGRLPGLLHHNVFFGRDFKRNLDQIFNDYELSEDPAFYASISARSEPGVAQVGHENLFVLLPCPNLTRPWTKEDEQAQKELIFRRLEEEVGFESSKVVGFKSYGPNEYLNELNLAKGAAFGLSHHFSQSAFMRPSNRSKSNPNVYFVGASTAPGNGIPMVLISADLLEQRLDKEMGL